MPSCLHCEAAARKLLLVRHEMITSSSLILKTVPHRSSIIRMPGSCPQRGFKLTFSRLGVRRSDQMARQPDASLGLGKLLYNLINSQQAYGHTCLIIYLLSFHQTTQNIVMFFSSRCCKILWKDVVMSNLATYEVILLRLRKVMYCTVSGGNTEVTFFQQRKRNIADLAN